MSEGAFTVAVVRDETDAVAVSGPVGWAVVELAEAIRARGGSLATAGSIGAVGAADVVIVAAGTGTAAAQAIAASAGVSLPTEAEALALAPGDLDGRSVLLAAGADARGLTYAVLELADRVRHGGDLSASLTISDAVVEEPANRIRGVTRLQVSDVEDLPWFYDRDGWQRYLTMLATHRFNRVHLAFGIGHDFLRNVRDSYLLFPYPFLIDVPGQDVRAVRTSDGTPLPDDERRRNLDTLRFISDEAAQRGLHFQLGIWTQQYVWTESPNATYITEGLHADNHADYCRDALRRILEACPGIAGVTLRVHGESGVPEGNYDFWRTVYGGIVACGRPVELDLHPKGVDRAMIDVALETGLTVNVSPKYTAEHLGLPGHQAAIRPTELMPRQLDGDGFVQGLMNRSHFDLSYTRYGYADFLEEGRPFGVYYRIWPGTQRILLWGSPELAAGYGRYGSIGGSLGVEVMEPLSFKGRRGSGLPGGRNAYADTSLTPTGGDWSKFTYTFRLFGRLLYNPDADAETWGRELRHAFGAAAGAVEAALTNASRILPLVTTAYHPSAANNRFWPEVYTSMPIVDENRPHPYKDTPFPRRFDTVSPHDPATFASVADFADQVMSGQRDGRYSPLRVADWLEAAATAATAALADAERAVADATAPSFRRAAVDVRIVAGLGRFYAGALRAGVAYALYTRTQARPYLEAGVAAYRAAVAAWEGVVEVGRAYRDDITVGGEPWLRGHWADRLPAIKDDLGDMEAALEAAPAGDSVGHRPLADLDPLPPSVAYAHTPPAPFRRGEPVTVALTARAADGALLTARLRYRRLNQAEQYQEAAMSESSGTFTATIPAAYTDSGYPLLYSFALHAADGRAWLYPGLATNLANQPYYVVRQA